MSSHLLRTAAPPLWHRHIKHFLSPPTTVTTVHRRQSHSRPPQGLRLPRQSDTAETGKGFGGDAYSFTAAKEKEKEKENKRRSRNESKREAREAVRWGMDLASFSTPQIKRILKVASLEPEVFEALMVVKRLGPDVREGKRRQFNLIGKLLRDADAQPELLGALIQATKDGDQSRFQALAGSVELVDEAAEEEFHESESEPELEDDGEHLVLASKWYDGLINKNIQISNEVYSVDNVEFDRQELRRLVRRVHNVQDRLNSDEETNAALETAKKSLNKFLCSLAKRLSMSDAEKVMM